VGREELIISGGENIQAAEIEQARPVRPWPSARPARRILGRDLSSVVLRAVPEEAPRGSPRA
jgi:hypothetical protein